MTRTAPPGRFAFGVRLPEGRGVFVYAYCDSTGRALYIGQTYDPYTRHAAHRQRSPWYADATHYAAIGRYETRDEAKAAEAAAISAFRPLHNRETRAAA